MLREKNMLYYEELPKLFYRRNKIMDEKTNGTETVGEIATVVTGMKNGTKVMLGVGGAIAVGAIMYGLVVRPLLRKIKARNIAAKASAFNDASVTDGVDPDSEDQ
jgi:type II secretory pathway component PulM